MSSIQTIFQTNDFGEHWFRDVNDGIVSIEIDMKNINVISTENGFLYIEIKPNCEISKIIESIKQ
jgi:hypothetical protein